MREINRFQFLLWEITTGNKLEWDAPIIPIQRSLFLSSFSCSLCVDSVLDWDSVKSADLFFDSAFVVRDSSLKIKSWDFVIWGIWCATWRLGSLVYCLGSIRRWLIHSCWLSEGSPFPLVFPFFICCRISCSHMICWEIYKVLFFFLASFLWLRFFFIYIWYGFEIFIIGCNTVVMIRTPYSLLTIQICNFFPHLSFCWVFFVCFFCVGVLNLSNWHFLLLLDLLWVCSQFVVWRLQLYWSLCLWSELWLVLLLFWLGMMKLISWLSLWDVEFFGNLASWNLGCAWN